ncbi:ATP-binding protein [Pseudonocardia sp. DSM 110487]|uniref:ATP-binding protein n=1 Tax=Pseudonocardia sp. DSM 110487 TaxID=2865833 RepID=UPI001C69B15B|nr:ATP-binding protein [Pseudonocardia sp. DSM 110487]QYN39376.1 ATP-binding protein [Pseudonocardia sp. DSM 110487]
MSHTATDRVEFVHQSWPAHPRQLAPIRAETRRWLAHPDLSDDVEQDVVLAVNEAASNAMEHAYARTSAGDIVEIIFWTEEKTVCVEIVDHGHWQPPDATVSGRGRGFTIMNELMQTVLIHYDIRGTRVLLRRTA